MAIVLPNICRYAIHASYVGREVVNIVDMHVQSTSGGPNRADAVHDVAGDILNNWDDHIRAFVVPEYVAQSISWVDLDSATGSVGSRASTTDTTWPAAGGFDAPPMPGMVAMRVIKQTTGGRLARKGRMYLAGIDEGATADEAPNYIKSATVAAWNTRMASFLSGIEDAGVANVVERFPVVIHTPASAAPSWTPVTGYTVDPLLGTQRRRTRG